MPITLPPITRRQFAKRSLALGGTAMMTSRGLAAADREGDLLDQNRVALLADTHISAEPDLVYPGTKWPGSPVGEDEHESVNIAQCLAEAAKSVIALTPRPAHLRSRTRGSTAQRRRTSLQRSLRSPPDQSAL